MAKDKAEPVFEEPEFDEKEFLRSEKDRAKGIILIFIIGALLGLLSGYFLTIGLWYFAVLLFFVIALFLKQIFGVLGVPLPKRGSHWFYLVMEYLIVWLVFWVIFLNPPLSVASGPQISSPQFQMAGGTWQTLNQSGSNTYVIYGGYYDLGVHVSYMKPITSYSVSESFSGKVYSLTSAYNTTSGYVTFGLVNGKEISQTYPADMTITVSSGSASNSMSFTLI
ncbi:MAG: hypothetical protein M1533_01615 [Candidatus Thermoplasmatota archaeon]|jgi:hypothetical protein|nr:hypothetical protein [Candidatus Thermoplasmatota archaeon]MCL5793686.1 hypothetical protein [Candidatus Thermoplasmatota archaeon]